MLNVKELQNQIKISIQNILVPAVEEVMKVSFPILTETNQETAKDMAEAFDNLVSEPLAEALANAIDYYVKNMSITGTIITTGSPVSQTAKIFSTKPITNGKIPNTLGVS